jgi:hypothetical protein
MAEPVPIGGLFEAHLTVADLGRAVAFFCVVEPRPELGIVPWSEWVAS